MRTDKDGSLLYSASRNTNPLTKHCVQCGRETAIAFSHVGSVLATVGFHERVTEEVVFNPVTNKMEIESTTKSVPITKQVTGTLCADCASDYSTITSVHKCSKRCSTPCFHVGEETWKPRVKLAARVSSTTSINPGYSRYHDAKPAEKVTKRVNWRGEVTDETLIYDPATNRTEQ